MPAIIGSQQEWWQGSHLNRGARATPIDVRVETPREATTVIAEAARLDALPRGDTTGGHRTWE
jgi:hypothetical protein